MKVLSFWFLKFFYFSTLILKKFPEKSVIKTGKILVFPSLVSSEDAFNILNRLAWGLGKSAVEIHYYGATPVKQKIDQEIFIDKVSNQKQVSYPEEIEQYELIIVHRWTSFLHPKLWFSWKRIRIIDPLFFSSVESDLLRKLAYDVLTPQQRKVLSSASAEIFEEFAETKKNKTRSVCFTTGPSFDRYHEFNFTENDLKVVCNSAVKELDFLRYIGGPDIVVFADPVFHFSPSNYAHFFREYLLEMIKLYPNTLIVVPESSLPLMLGWYPELQGKIIGMPAKKEFNFPQKNHFFVKGSDNILTFLMIPISSALTKEVAVIGADGRSPKETYFWQHSKKAQMHQHMDSAFRVHPSFFRDRNYASYYDEHCEFLENQMRYGEERGVRYYSLTPSFIPALLKRKA